MNNEMQLNDLGACAHQCWMDIPQHFPFVVLDEFVVMPNHVHGILFINKPSDNVSLNVETQNFASLPKPANTEPTNTEPTNTKSANIQPTNIGPMNIIPININPINVPQINIPSNKFGPQSQNLASIIRGYKIGLTKFAQTHSIPFQWQPRYFDRIIRNECELHDTRQYIRNNPKQWELDRNNPENYPRT